MSVNLDPITIEKMDRFGRRRRRMVWTRGICSATVSILVLMSLVALADWRWVLSDSLRWTLSGLGYAGAAVVVWMTCLRLILRSPDQRNLARRVETAEPQLRENLLSAIELTTDDASEARDSSTFRQLLQNHVGLQMADVDIRTLLPVRLLGKWLVAAAAIVIACATLLSLPGLPFRQLMTRAMLPGANIDRVSRIQVTILQPTPHSLILPQEETVAVLVEISGGHVDEVTLELQGETNGVTRQQMRATDAGQFVSNVSIGNESIEYRVLAGDAVTRKYRIDARPRPHVKAFHKTFRFPDYAALDDRIATDPHGDLIALEGTEVDLVLDIDQDVTQAEIRLDRSDSDAATTVALDKIADRRFRATLTLDKPGIYKVHLVSKETGFDNPFSPKYEIKPEPDLIPRVGFVGQQEGTLLLPPNDILPLEGLAEDDLPLVALEQHISVNGLPWEKVSLKINEARRVTTSWQWDLLELNLKSGDQVTTKLVATDRKGNTGESVPLNVVVSSPDFDPDRHAVMRRKSELYDMLVELNKVVSRHQASAEAILKRVREADRDIALKPEDRASVLDLAGKVREETDRVSRHILQILPTMPSGADAYELELVSRVMARIQHESMNVPRVYLDAFTGAADPEDGKKDLQRVLEAFSQSAEDTSEMANRYQQLLAHNIMAAIAYDLDALLQHQRQLVTSRAPLTWQRLVRQETVAINHIHILEKLIDKHLVRLPASTQRALRNNISWARSSRERLEAATESEDRKLALEKLAHTLVRELGDRQNADVLDGQIPKHILEARKQLDVRAGSAYVAIERLGQSGAEFQRYVKQAAESGDSVDSRKARQMADRAAAEFHRLHFPSTIQLHARKRATQLRRDFDAQYASDNGMTRRAVTALVGRFKTQSSDGSDVASIFADIAPAYRILEAGHEMVHVQSMLTNLLALERWNSQEISARLDHPRQWDAVHTGLETVVRKLREARFPREIVTQIDHIRWSTPAQNAGRKIAVRRHQHDPMFGAAQELLEIDSQLDAIMIDLEPVMQEARALIAQYVPTIPEMATQAAEDLRELEEQTTSAADQLTESDSDQHKSQMDELRQEQQLSNLRIEDLVEALVEDANKQDLLTDDGRERARDADGSIALVHDRERQMNQAMQKAVDAKRPDDQARDLSAAAEKQEQTADALDRIASHFERLETGKDIAQSREALRQTERELGIARQMEQRYDPAQQLGELAQKNAQELLAELEAELQNNPAMQNALSEISRDVVQQAKNSLEFSAEQERNLQRTVERADPEFRKGKKELAEELRDIARQASRLGHNVVAQADNAATRGESKQAHEFLSKAKKDLLETAARPRNVHGDSALRDIVEAAREMADRLDKSSKDLTSAQEATSKEKDEDIHDTAEKRADRQREMEQTQRQIHEQKVREARDKVRARGQVERQVTQRERSAQNSVRNATRQVQSAQTSLRRKPDDKNAKNRLAQAKARQADAQAQLDQAKGKTGEAKQQTAGAKQALKKLEQHKMLPLDAANPSVELAHRLTTQAKKAAEDLARRANEVAQDPAWASEFDPDARQMAGAAQQQQGIRQDVSQTAEDVARAARHEQRLGKPPISDQLGEAAVDIQHVADDDVAGSEQQMSAVAEAQRPDSDNTVDHQAAIDANKSVAEAEQAIAQQAEALGQILDAAEDQARDPSGQAQTGEMPAGKSQPGQPQRGPPAPGQAQSGQQSPAEVAHGELLARTLDDLDRNMAGQSDAGATSLPQPPVPSLAQAAHAQAAKLARTRMTRQIPTSAQASSENALESVDGAAIEDISLSEFTLESVNRLEREDWGQLREKSAEDLTEGRRESVAAEYRKRVETYFRVIAERARKKK